MEHQKRYKKGQPISETEARRILDEYLNRLEAKWKEAGLPCIKFSENREELKNELLQEVGKIYPLTDRKNRKMLG